MNSNPDDTLLEPPELCLRALATQRIHSGYIIQGPSEESRQVSRWFARALACENIPEAPCEACNSCRRSTAREEPELDGSGKKGALYRHIGDHPDLFWIERGSGDTRVRIGQLRAVQKQLYLQSSGRQVLVVSDASWLNVEAQNCILRLLEEPPVATHILLLTENPASLLATVRSRCQRIILSPSIRDEPSPEISELLEEINALVGSTDIDVLNWAETYRGPRVQAAAGVDNLLQAGCLWIHTEATERRASLGGPFSDLLDTWYVLRQCRKALVQRNANPQMIAERALRAISRIRHG